MKRLVAALFVIAISLASSPVRADEVSFYPLYVYVDSGDRRLSVYQFELLYDAEAITIVGIEGGTAPFDEAPYYDPAGMDEGRIVIGSFTTDEDPPRGRVLVAVLHVMQERTERRERGARLVLTAGPDGEKFEAAIDIFREEGEGEGDEDE